MSIILCGLPMCGKSYFGQRVADKLGMPFIDVDISIENAFAESTGRRLTCREIAIAEGDPAFRRYESQAIQRLDPQSSAVIAIGGGALMDSRNIEKLKSVGSLIYLQIEMSILLSRLRERKYRYSYLDSTVPEQSFVEMAHQRIVVYQSYAHYIIDITALKDEDVVEWICSKK